MFVKVKWRAHVTCVLQNIIKILLINDKCIITLPMSDSLQHHDGCVLVAVQFLVQRLLSIKYTFVIKCQIAIITVKHILLSSNW